MTNRAHAWQSSVGPHGKCRLVCTVVEYEIPIITILQFNNSIFPLSPGNENRLGTIFPMCRLAVAGIPPYLSGIICPPPPPDD